MTEDEIRLLNEIMAGGQNYDTGVLGGIRYNLPTGPVSVPPSISEVPDIAGLTASQQKMRGILREREEQKEAETRKAEEERFREFSLAQRLASIPEAAAMFGTTIPASVVAPVAKEVFGTPEAEFTERFTYMPRTDAGLSRAASWGESIGRAAEAVGESAVGQALSPIVEKIPGIFPVSAATVKAFDVGPRAVAQGAKLAAELPRVPFLPELLPLHSLPAASSAAFKKATEATTEAAKGVSKAVKEEFQAAPVGAVQLQQPAAPRSDLGLYSNAEQAVLNLKQNKGTGNQFLAQITNTPGVKPAELEWTGLSDFLKSKGNQPVTKAEVADYLATNKVQVNEKQLLEPEDFERKINNEAFGYTDYSAQLNNGELDFYVTVRTGRDTETDEQIDFYDLPQYAQDALNEFQSKYGLAKFGPSSGMNNLVLPGGENYREILLTLPEKTRPLTLEEVNAKRANVSSFYPRMMQSEYNFLLQAGEIKQVPRTPDYRSPHFDEPNIVAHMRVDDRFDANGNKVLFVEELQSDWGQIARKEGTGEKLKSGWRMAEQEPGFFLLMKEGYSLPRAHGTREEVMKAADRMDAVIKGVPNAPFISSHKYQVIKDGKELVTKNQKGKDVLHIYDNPEDAAAAAKKFGGEVQDMGMQESTEDWVNLSLKRLITDAVNNDYKKVAFINGQQSADRYDLSTVVDKIVVKNFYPADDYRTVAIVPKDGKEEFDLLVNKNGIIENTPAPSLNNLINKPLSEAVGKEMAEKIMSGKAQVIEGGGLNIGGQGMKKFYDQIIPNTVNKLLKKLGGGKLETVKLEDGSEQIGFTITPEMRELVKGGLPLFAKGGRVLSSIVEAGKKAKEAQATKKPQAPEIKKSSKLAELERELTETGGKRQGLRLQRAADEIPGLEDQYEIQALRRAFRGRKGYPYQGVMTMDPKDFQEFALSLNFPLSSHSQENIERLRSLLSQGGSFEDVPFLQMDKKGDFPSIVGHEGRHRARALAAEKHPKTLVEVYPFRGLEMGADDEPMSATEWLRRFNEELAKNNRYVFSEDETNVLKLPEVYAQGGSVSMKKGGSPLDAMIQAGKKAKAASDAKRREQRVQQNLEKYMGTKDKPKTYYHATQATDDFSVFDLERRPHPAAAKAVFVTPSPQWASEWIDADMKMLEKTGVPKPRLMPVITRAKNPFDYENPTHVNDVLNRISMPGAFSREHVAEQIGEGNWNFIEDRKVQQAIKDLGFDSFYVQERGMKNLGVFDPTDVKSLFNRGSYDPTTQDISKRQGGLACL